MKKLILPNKHIVGPKGEIFPTKKRGRKKKSPAEIDTIVENRYMGLPDNFDESQMTNILMDAGHSQLFRGDPIMEILDIMREPEYFYYTCKWLLNIELAPFQLAILYELWTRKFPMLIASRGAGKTFILALYAMLRAIFTQGSKIIIVGAAFRQSKLMFEYMETFWRGAPILRHMVGSGKSQGPKRDIDRCTFYIGDSVVTALPIGDGCLLNLTSITTKNGFSTIENRTDELWGNGKWRKTDDFLDNGEKDVKIVTTKKGYSYGATHNHKMRVLRDKKIEWVRTDEMKVGDCILIDRSKRWHGGDFECSDSDAYSLGSMIGDGNWTQEYLLGFATEDAEHFIPYLNDARYMNEWKQQTDGSHWCMCGVVEKQSWINFWNLQDNCYAKDKVLPSTILSAPQERMTACLQGLFDTDGHMFSSKAKGGTTVAVGFTNTSKVLVEQMQYILLHYGIISRLSHRDRDDKWNRVYELLITGKDAELFAEKIGFRLKRKQERLIQYISEKKRSCSIGDVIPGVREDMIRIAKANQKRIPLKDRDSVRYSRIAGRKNITMDLAKSFLFSYSFTNDPFIEELKELANPDIYYDEIVDITDSYGHTYDMHVPNGHEYCANGFFSHNSKIRGLRANYTLADEYASIPLEIFEVVIKGFSSVSSAPTEKAKQQMRIDVLQSLGFKEEAEDIDLGMGNQTVISGTAYYSFNHFYDYFKRYKEIIESCGDKRKLEEIFKGEVPDSFDWTQFSIFRVPWTKLPKGFMDETQISQAKATVHLSTYLMEYGAEFAKDSDGFFKRTLIEACVCRNPIEFPSGPVQFNAVTRGEPNKKYIYGIDPASENDNFALVILELHEDHRRIVYSWSINRQILRERIKKKGQKSEKSFYSYCARKIRDLMKIFPTDHIGIDSQGGGIAIMEALKDIDNCEEGEQLLWPYVRQGNDDVFWWEKENKPTDGEPGQHILYMVNFADAKFTQEANHGMRKDFESKTTIFPFFDAVTIEEAIHLDKIHGREYDTLEDCYMEIEELKTELTTIEHTQTTGGRDHWDTPKIKLPGNKVGRLRKDRYSALLIGNMIARVMTNKLEGKEYQFIGGYSGQRGRANQNNDMYYGPDHIVSKMDVSAYMGIKR